MMNFDTIVVGAGQAGPFLAAKLVNRGRKVALVEARDLGGTCVNRGCTPTKTLRKSARVAYLARRAAEFGVQVGPVKVDFAVAMQRMQDRVDQARSGLESWLGGLEGLQHLGHGSRHVGVFPPRQARPRLDDCDLAAEAAKDLRHLKADVPASDDHQLAG